MSDQQDRPKCPNTPKYPCGGCPACRMPLAAAPDLWPWLSGFRDAWPTPEAIAAHQGGRGRWLVIDPRGVKTLGHFDGDTFRVVTRWHWHVVGSLESDPILPWKFEPVTSNFSLDPLNWRKLLGEALVPPEAPATNPQPPATPSAADLPAGPALAPGVRQVDQRGFGSWPSEEMIRAHEGRGGRWLAKAGDDLWLGSFGRSKDGKRMFIAAGGACWRWQEDAAHWTFCPIDDNGDKLDAAPVLRGEDARRLAEQLGQVAPPGEIARRRAEARRHLAESEAAAERLVRVMTGPDHAARILSTLPDRSPDRRVLVVLRGLPGSGKSTIAQAIVDSDPSRWARVSKDDLRQMMVGPSGDLFRFVEDRAREVVVAKTAEEMTMSALRLGLDVVVDATNLTNKALNSWRLAAMVVNRDGNGPVLVCERAVPTPVEECIARDARRGARSVGRVVIERLAATVDLPLADREVG